MTNMYHIVQSIVHLDVGTLSRSWKEYLTVANGFVLQNALSKVDQPVLL
jgi:hypothetical protein